MGAIPLRGYTPVAPGIDVLVVSTRNQKKNHQRMHSTPHYMHAIEILLIAYAMVITLDEAGQEWLHLDVARLYLARLRKLERLDAVSDPIIWPHIAECETQARSDWRDRNLSDPSMSLGDIVALSLARDRFPDASKFIPARQPRIRGPKQQNAEVSQSFAPHESYPKYAPPQDSYNKRQKRDGEHATRGPKGDPYMEKDFCHRNQRNSCSHVLACRYARDSAEMATLQACDEANMW